jgi:RHS repeat-associated protein
MDTTFRVFSATFLRRHGAGPIGLPSLRVGPDGTLYVGDEYGYRVCKVGPPLAGFSAPTTDYEFSSADGSRVYTFDGTGRHLTTLDAITGAALYTFGYDSAGHLASVTDVNGDQTTITRDASGNPTSVTSPFGVTTTLQNGSDGYLASIQDPTGAMYQMAYGTGLLSTIEFPSGFASTKTYDSLGRVATSTDAAGGELTFTRAPDTISSIGVTKTTSLGVTTQYSVTVGSSNSSSWTNQLPGNLTSTKQIGADASQAVTSPDGTQTNTAYTDDPRFGMLAPIPATTTVKLPSGLTSTTTMTRAVTIGTGSAPLAALTDTTVVNGNTWTRAFAVGPPATWTTTSPVGRTSSMTIDSAGRPLTTSVPNVTPFSFLYDSHGRLQQTTQGTRTWLTGYDANGYASSQTDPLSNTVSTLNDLDGRPLTTTLQDQREVGTGWDGDGNMLNITLPGALATQPDPSREHQFSFTPVDLTQTYTPPAIGVGLPSTSYSYDADRFLTTITRPDGVVVTHVPDAFERLSQIQYPQGALSYGYSSTTGQLLTTTTPGGETTTFTYDGFLQKSITWSGPVAGSIAFGYNSDFHVTSQTLNSGTAFPFGYDADGLLTCAGASTCPVAGALGLTLDLHNGRLNATALGSVADAYGYDANGLLASYAATFGGSSALYSETIVSRDLNERITEKTDVLAGTSHDWKYVYDVAGRLTDVTEDGNFEAHYGYDGDDNRTTFTNASGTVNPTYDVQDRLNSYGPATYAFTANGELTSKTLGGQVTSYTYDALGNLLHVGLPAALPDGVQTIDYIVDGQNRRVGKMVNGTLSQGWLYQDQLRPVAQLDGANNVVARFVYGSKPNVPDYMVTSGGTYRILSDHLGSPRAVVDANSRSVIETINFDEFGNETDTLATALPTGYVRIPFGFAGGLYDPDTGLVRFGTRDYDASVGRWTSKDPIRFGGGRNLYGYVVNDPIYRFDPFGQGPSEVLTCVLACSAAASPTYEACFLLVEAPPAFAACLAAIDIGYYICVATCHSSDICNGGIF